MWTAFQFPLLDLPPLPIPKYLISSELVLGPYEVFITYVFPKEMVSDPRIKCYSGRYVSDAPNQHFPFSHCKNPFLN